MASNNNINLFKHLNHGKKSPEDKLTSYIFTTIHLLYQNDNKNLFKEFLEKVDINWNEDKKWKLKLWPRYKDNEQVTDQSIVEPDVVYETDNFVICIECKRNGCFSTGQLNRERDIWTDTRLNDRKLQLIAISDDLIRPDVILEANENSNLKWQWMPWRFFYKKFRKVLIKDSITLSTKFILNSIITYMEEYNMSGFTNFNAKSLWNYTASLDNLKNATNDLGNFIVALDNYLNKENSRGNSPIYRRFGGSSYCKKGTKSDEVYPRTSKLEDYNNWIRNQYYFPYYHKDWEREGASHDLFIMFNFTNEPTLKIGIRLNVNHVENDTDKSRNDLIEELSNFKRDEYQPFGTNKNAPEEPNQRLEMNSTCKFLGTEKVIKEFYKQKSNQNGRDLFEQIKIEFESLAGEEGFSSFFKHK